mgnify:CR=1 FL=1
MTKQDILDTIDSLVASIRRSEDDISNLVNQQIELGFNEIDLVSYYYKHQCQYYRDNPTEFMDDYLWEFVDAY